MDVKYKGFTVYYFNFITFSYSSKHLLEDSMYINQRDGKYYSSIVYINAVYVLLACVHY